MAWIEWLERLPAELNHNFALLALIGFVSIFIETFLPIIPLTPLIMWNGYVLGGVFGFIVSFAAAGSSIMLLYVLFERFSHRIPERWKNTPVAQWVGRQRPWTLSIAFMLPGVPHLFFIAALVLFRIGWRTALGAVCLGLAVKFLFFTVLGHKAMMFMKHPHFLFFLLPFVVVLWYINKRYGIQKNAAAPEKG
ncbi:MAG: VTT domain-containing protein [Bacilli bacterium]